MQGALRVQPVEDALGEVVPAVLEHDAPLADLYASIARKVGTPAKVQLKVETGLNRLGVPINEAAGLLENWSRCDALQLTGIYSHLSTSADRATDLEQLELFERFMKDHGAHLGEVPLHLCNSHGLRHFPEGFFGAVRVGLALYGVESVLPGLEPTLECRARVMQRKRVRRGEGVSYNKLFRAPKDMDVAVLAIGYAEGLSQALTGKMEVLINGHRRPVVGQICMNLCVVDVDGIPAERGDAATLIGRETMADGSTDEIRVADMAKAAGIRHHEIITRLGLSLPRRYKAACAAVEASPGSVSAAAL